jgi:hypothetical protein
VITKWSERELSAMLKAVLFEHRKKPSAKVITWRKVEKRMRRQGVDRPKGGARIKFTNMKNSFLMMYERRGGVDTNIHDPYLKFVSETFVELLKLKDE